MFRVCCFNEGDRAARQILGPKAPRVSPVFTIMVEAQHTQQHTHTSIFLTVLGLSSPARGPAQFVGTPRIKQDLGFCTVEFRLRGAAFKVAKMRGGRLSMSGAQGFRQDLGHTC